MEVYTDCSRHSAESGHNKRMGATKGASEWKRNAIRVCGDWSEQLSSKGKIYYYNCMTEVSQWQKPTEWMLPDMDDRELVQRVGTRSVDGKGLKRHRMFTSTSNVLKITSASDRSESPKRLKINSETSNVGHRNSVGPIRTQIIDCNSSVGAVLDSRIYTTVGDPQNHQGSVCGYRDEAYRNQTKKCISGGVGSRSAIPYEDMEISPNSSPMSGSSSPMNSYSPHHLRYREPNVTRRDSTSRMQRINPNAASAGRTEDASKLERSSSTKLLQLVDAIRDILEQSPSSATQRLTTVASPVNGVVFGGLPRNQSCSLIDMDGHGMGSPRTRDNYQNSQVIPRSVGTVSLMSNRVTTNSFCSALVENDTVSYQTQGASKLTSTLTSLASLINTPRDRSSKTDTSFCSLGNSTSASHLVGAQTPNLLHHSTSQEHAGSPVIRSSPTDNFPDNVTPDFSSSHRNFHCTSSQLGSVMGKMEPVTQTCSDTPYTSSCTVYVNNSRDCVMDSVVISPSGVNRSLYSDFDNLDILKSGGPCIIDRNQGEKLIVSSSELDQRHNFHKSPCITFGDKNLSSCASIPLPSSSPNSQKHVILESKSMPSLQRLTDLGLSSTECVSKRRLSLREKCFPGVECLEEANRVLDCSQIQAYLDPKLCIRYHEEVFERLENEAHCESKRFDRLQSVLYSELSVESKKLRALVRISEAKLAVHKEKQNSLQDLMDAIENRRHLLCSWFGDDNL